MRCSQKNIVEINYENGMGFRTLPYIEQMKSAEIIGCAYKDRKIVYIHFVNHSKISVYRTTL